MKNEMIKNLGVKGYSVYKKDLDPNELDAITKELTVIPYIPEGYGADPKPFKLYQEGPNKIYVPKSYGLKKFGLPSSFKYIDPVKINIDFKGSLRQEQEEPVKRFIDSCHDLTELGGILNLPCGYGKTTIAIYLIAKLSVKTLIIVHKDFLLQQWKERIEQFAPNTRIGYIKAKVIDVENKDIVIGSLQSLSMKTYEESVFDGFGFAILDEVHHSSAEVFSRAFRKITFKYTLGLSATIKRKDGLSKVFHWYLGDVLYSVKRRSDTLKVMIRRYFDSHPDYSTEHVLYTKKPNIAKMVNQFCGHKPRNKFIEEIICPILKEQPTRKVLILSDRRSHLEDMKVQFEKIGFGCGLYYGGLKQEILKESETKQLIFATFHMVSEGFDLSSLDTLILASPKSDIVQSVGRILRTPEHLRVNIPLIIDIVDDMPMFKSQTKKRKDYYKKCKYEIDDNSEENPSTFRNKVILPKGVLLIEDE
jgi:superfamily II DNA or RNA helicase